MECGNRGGPSAAALLVELAGAIPAWQYLVACLFLASVFLYNILEVHLLGDVLHGYRGDKVLLTYNPASEIFHGVVSRCRVLHGRYLATSWLSSPHLQTTFLNFFGNPPTVAYRRQIFCLSDGGTIALDWVPAFDVSGCSSETNKVIPKDDTTPLVIIVPGLTSDTSSPYIKHLVYNIAKQGWNVVVGNHRGLGGVSITSDCFYNAGWTEDVRKVINHLCQEYPKAPLFAIGTSIGANILVKYLGEEGEGTPLAGAASVCSPWDLVVCDRFINRKLVQRLYDKALAIGLKGYAQLHQPIFSRLANWDGIKMSRSVRDFDNYATRLVGNFETVDTYYRHCCSASFLGNVAVPLLCISALDDPVCTMEAIPWDECRANKNIVLATTAHGGHLGFFEGITASNLWWVRAVCEFMDVLHSSSFMHGQKKTHTGLHSSLESSIDQAPYVNIMEDGMVSAVANDAENYDSGEEPNNSHLVGVQQNENPFAGTGQLEEETEARRDVQEAAESSGQKKENKTSDLHDVISPMKKSIQQLSRLNTRSVWLLAYIAVVTTWPVVGPALFLILKSKFKNILPARWLSR